MKASGNRPGRKEQLRRRTIGERPRRRAPWLAMLALLAVTALAASVTSAYAAGPALTLLSDQAEGGGAATTSAAGPGGAATTVAGAARGAGLAFTPMRPARATWYGPGFYGNRTACGQVLTPRTVGVAHRRLPCGTTVKFAHRGRYLVTRVIDRGPFTRGNAWDLTNGARRALGFSGSKRVRYAIAIKYASR